MTDYTKTIPSLEISSTLEVSYSDSGQQHILCSLHSCSHNYNQKFEKNESFIRDAELLCYLRLCTVKMQNDRIKIISERSWIRTENLTENTWAFEKYYSQLLCLKCLLSTYINCLCFNRDHVIYWNGYTFCFWKCLSFRNDSNAKGYRLEAHYWALLMEICCYIGGDNCARDYSRFSSNIPSIPFGSWIIFCVCDI